MHVVVCYYLWRPLLSFVRSSLPFIDEESVLPSPSSVSSSVQADGSRFPSSYPIQIPANPWFSFVPLDFRFYFRFRLENKRLPTKGPSDDAIRSARRKMLVEKVEGQSRIIFGDGGGGS